MSIVVRTASPQFGMLQVTQNTIRGGGGAGISVRPLLRAAGLIDVTCVGNHASGQGSTGITINTQGDITASDNTVTDVGGAGILLRGGRDASAVQALRNAISNAGGGLVVEGARAVQLVENQVSDSGTDGYQVSNAEAVTVTGNRAERTMRGGIYVAADARLRGNCNYDGRVSPQEVQMAFAMLFGEVPPRECSAIESDRNGRVTVANVQAVLLDALLGSAGPQPSGSVDVHDNQAMDVGDVGVLIVARDGTMAERNVVHGTGSVGLSVTGRRSAVVSMRMNTIEESGAEGMLSAGSQAVTIADNVVHGTGENGIRLRDAESAVPSSNTLRQTMGSAMLATGGTALQVTDNDVEDSFSGGVEAEGLLARTLSAVIERNRIVNVGGAGILIDSAALADVADNHVAGSVGEGAALRRSTIVRLRGNDIRESGRGGMTVGTVVEPAGEDVVVEGNSLEASGKAAADLVLTGRVVLHANVVRHSQEGGVSITQTNPKALAAVVANRIGPTRVGGLSLHGGGPAYVFDNVVFSVNSGNGIEVGNRPTGHIEVVNNLAYAASGDGIRVDGVDARIFNNTAYANGRYGVAVSAATATVFDNVLDRNGTAGLAVLTTPAPGISASHNLNTGAYLGIEPSPTDLTDEPRFVDPEGADDILGGDGAADDDFHLQTGDDGEPASPAIDAGLDTPETLGLSGSTASDGRRDTGFTDLGYHYDASPRFP